MGIKRPPLSRRVIFCLVLLMSLFLSATPKLARTLCSPS